MIPHYQTYTFEFRKRGRSIVADNARWVGESRNDHPDFAWYPYVVQSANPEMNYKVVKQVVHHHSSFSGGTTTRPDGSSNNDPSNAGSANNRREADIPANVAPTPASSSDRISMSPMQLVSAIANRTSGFGFDVRLHEFGRTRYEIGESTRIVGASEEAGYLYLFHINPLGEPVLLFPDPRQENRVAAGGTFEFPAREARPIELNGPLGTHCIKAIITRQPVALTGFVAAPRGQRLHVNSTQHDLIRRLLFDYVNGRDENIPQRLLVVAGQSLPVFAQDEVTFYVGPSE